jgi:hypothetical protein
MGATWTDDWRSYEDQTEWWTASTAHKSRKPIYGIEILILWWLQCLFICSHENEQRPHPLCFDERNGEFWHEKSVIGSAGKNRFTKETKKMKRLARSIWVFHSKMRRHQNQRFIWHKNGERRKQIQLKNEAGNVGCTKNGIQKSIDLETKSTVKKRFSFLLRHFWSAVFRGRRFNGEMSNQWNWGNLTCFILIYARLFFAMRLVCLSNVHFQNRFCSYCTVLGMAKNSYFEQPSSSGSKAGRSVR